jgi:hypothetical protein
MKRGRKIEIALWAFIFIFAAAWVASEVRWSRINSPRGKFDNAQEYIDHGRLPARAFKIQKAGETFFIAMSPMDTSFALTPSGPAAYVFDDTGRMVDWTDDIGDDSDFKVNWPRPYQESSLEELKKLGREPGDD